jgi:CubicO group peptidase (beta-lactamase class C family)
MSFNIDHWQSRLDKLRATHHVPGATLAVLTEGEVHELASGLLHRGTGVDATPNSIFQLGSIAKIYTATMVMKLVEAGRLDLDAPVRDVLPDFRVADPEATKTITPRQLLSHTSGMSGDLTLDTGRGDDCIAKYVEACETLTQDCPPGTAVSYSSSGYNVLGRIVEVLTGGTWDAALRDMIVTPLGLTHTMTLPEEALRFRTAMSHLGEQGDYPDPALEWDMMPRSAAPYGRVLASAGDVLRMARAHLEGGLLTPESAETMRRREVDVPDKWTVSSDGWGLGWTLYDWDGVPGHGHDGAAIGQYAYLRVVPSAGVIAVLLTNGGGARGLYASLFRELLGELAGVEVPPPFSPPTDPPAVDLAPWAGTYRREGMIVTATAPNRIRMEFVDGMAHFADPIETTVVPVTNKVFAASGVGPSFSESWMPVVFTTQPDGSDYVYIGMRATPKISEP